MTSIISKFVIKTLCDNDGSLDFKRLNESIAQSFTVAPPVLRSVRYDDGKIAIQEGRQKVVGGQIISPDSLIVAKTSLRLCQRKPGECDGNRCGGLHLCRYYVCGDCTFGWVHSCCAAFESWGNGLLSSLQPAWQVVVIIKTIRLYLMQSEMSKQLVKNKCLSGFC